MQIDRCSGVVLFGLEWGKQRKLASSRNKEAAAQHAKYTKQSWPSVMEGDWILSLDDMERHGGFVDILVGMGSPAPFLFLSCLLQ
jgi:hypothetical protein